MVSHVRHLRRHKNVLYGIVVILLILQVFSFVVFTSRLAEVQESQDSFRQSIEKDFDDLRADNQYKVNELVREVSMQGAEIVAQKSSFDRQLENIRESQSDFSEVIDTVLKGVVSIGTDKSAGTGFVVHAAGYVVTNNHVIEGARSIKVMTYDNNIYNARLVGTDSTTDMAVLKIDGIFYPIQLADANETQIGEHVIAIGNPLGLSFSVTQGIVSALHRQGPNGQDVYIQTDVTLNPGNSGGPLINTAGRAIGMNNFKIGNAEGLGFAVESEVIKNLANKISNTTLIE